jgi:ABC-type antimicrobial peptide transport system permease subunit
MSKKRKLRWGGTSTDSLTFVTVLLLVFLAGTFACCLPARRAISLDPAVALRYE